MYCLRCNNLGLKAVYICLDCKDDRFEGETDYIMCKECKKEHIEANYGNKTRFKTIRSWQELDLWEISENQ